jgi:hypothetical protein
VFVSFNVKVKVRIRVEVRVRIRGWGCVVQIDGLWEDEEHIHQVIVRFF